MDPAQCSVVVVAGCDCHLCLHKDSSSSSNYPYTSLLQQVFAQVVIENHGHAALTVIRQRLPKNGQPTLLLIDLDICPHANQLVHPAISLLQQVVKELKAGSLHDIAPVVCSNNESAKFMLQCIQEGAADYVLKPLRKDVLKTMFLNLHRYQMEGSDVHAISDSSSGSQTVHEAMGDALDGDLLWNGLQNHRLREVFLKDSRAGKFSYHGVIPYLEKAWYRSSAWWAEINNLCWLYIIEFRKCIVHVILATDMGLHNDYVAKFRDQADRLKNGRPLDLSDEAACERERTLLFSAIIKCADIGNVSRPFKHGLKWAQVLVDEFSAQGDLERELGLPVMPINDRGKLSQEDVQIGFIKHVALPLFEVVDSIIPNFTFTVDAIKENLDLWEQRKDLGVEPPSDAASCHSQATVEVIHSRRSSLTNINPYGIQSFKVQDDATLKPKSSVRSLADMFSKYNKREVDWQTSEAPSPLCACCIQ
ncbi:hypothetical protein NQZ79_g7302 [Umbelopsis isabellina]|nr:hypothetical protein NQZ79_g7302 [Umbelopsis isabellina]